MEPQNLKLGSGGLKSPDDAEDWTLASVGAPTTVPASVKLDTDWMIASMQSQIGCCVGCTGEEMVRQIIYITTGVQSNPGTPNELSWRFVYAMAKALEGTAGFEQWARTAGSNDGTYPSLVAYIIKNYGVPLAKYCPNDATLDPDTFCYNRVLANIPAAAKTDALTRKSGAYLTEPISQSGIQQALAYALANKGGVMILRSIGDTYWIAPDGTSSWDKTKILPIRIPSAFTSGHEEFLTGYDFEPGTNRMRIYWLNHWSPEWADNGRGWEYADVWLPHIVELRVVVAALPVPPATFKYNFTKQLNPGDKGPDVVALQHVLELEGCFNYPTFTGNYLSVTTAGVTALQEKYTADILTPAGLTKGTGNVGPRTLAWLIKKYGN